MADNKRLIGEKALRAFVENVFKAAGCSEEDARSVADVLVWANLRGIDSHGISRIPRYLELFASGEAKPRAEMAVTAPAAAVVVVDARGAPGPVALKRAMSEAIALAKKTGVAWAAVRGTVHTGAIGYYTDMAAAAGLIGVGLVAGIPNMVYHGARGSAVATSPLAISVPGKERSLTLDMATAIIALGRIQQYKIRGLALPEGAAVTAEGEPTTDAAKATIPLPMGGPKGSGMSLAFELLTSVLLGAPIVTPYHAKTPGSRKHRQNAAMIALDPTAFGDRAAFGKAVDETLATIKGLQPLQAGSEVLLPGERGARNEKERKAAGVPVPPKTWKDLEEAAAKLGVAMPAVVA